MQPTNSNFRYVSLRLLKLVFSSPPSDPNTKCGLDVILDGRTTSFSEKLIGKAEWNSEMNLDIANLKDENLSFNVKTSGNQVGTGKQSIGELKAMANGKLDSFQKIVPFKGKDGSNAGNLQFQVRFHEVEDIVGGTQMPNLSLYPSNYKMATEPIKSMIGASSIVPAPMKSQPSGPVKFVLENRKPATTNLFTIFDGDFKNFELFPATIKTKAT